VRMGSGMLSRRPSRYACGAASPCGRGLGGARTHVQTAVSCIRWETALTEHDSDSRHPRVRPRESGEVSSDVRGVFDVFMRERGNIPNMFRTVGIRAKHLTTMIAHFRTVMNEGSVSPLLKELLAVRVSSLNRCRY